MYLRNQLHWLISKPGIKILHQNILTPTGRKRCINAHGQKHDLPAHVSCLSFYELATNTQKYNSQKLKMP